MAISISKSKKAIFFVVAAGMLSTSFFFQNCSRGAANKSSLLPGDSMQTAANDPAKIELKNEQINQVDLNVDTIQTINQNGHQYSLKQSETLSIDFATGQFNVSTQANKLFCLSGALKEELSAILNTAAICKKKEVAAADTVCSQSIKSAYAEIHLASDSYKLGLYSNNCTGEYIDLCDTQSDMLKGFAKSLKNNLVNLNCP